MRTGDTREQQGGRSRGIGTEWRPQSSAVTVGGAMAAAVVLAVLAAVTVKAEAVGQAATQWDTPPPRQNLATFSPLTLPALTVTLKARAGTTLPAEALVVASGPSGTFTGDVSGAKALEFQLVSDGHLPQVVNVWLVGRASGRVWISRQAAMSSDARAVVVNDIPLDRVGGGWQGPGGDVDAAWAQDTKDVAYLGVRFKQLGLELQNYAIRGFMLMGTDNGTQTLALKPVDATLWDKYRVLTAAAVPADKASLDSDKDGMTDVNEVLTGTNPNDPSSRFTTEIRGDGSGIRVQWPCVDGGLYVLRRADAVGGAYAVVSGTAPLSPTSGEATAGVMGFLDTGATGAGPYFYKVEKQ